MSAVTDLNQWEEAFIAAFSFMPPATQRAFRDYWKARLVLERAVKEAA